MNVALSLKFGDRVEITLGSSKTKDLRTLQGTFVGLHFRPITEHYSAVEARVMTSEGEVTDHRVTEIDDERTQGYVLTSERGFEGCVIDCSTGDVIRDVTGEPITTGGYGQAKWWSEALSSGRETIESFRQWDLEQGYQAACPHGLSASNCYGPSHYASDEEIARGW